MPDMERLHLEDALEDSPQTRHLLMVFEKDAMQLKKFTVNMHNCCQRIMSAQNELCAATQALAQQLRAYEIQKFPLESEDSILTSTLKQFSSYLDDISSIHQVLSQQFSETMMYPLNKFLQADLEEITTMHEMFQIATQEHEHALMRYMKLPKKKEDKSRADANDDLFNMRKKFHQTALHYYSALNALQYKRKCQLLEPVLGYLHAQRAFFPMGQDAVCKPEVEDFLSNIGASVQGVHAELAQETQKTVELIDTIEKQSAHLYHAEPPIDMPFIPPNTSLAQKAGYLMYRSRQALLASKWERLYFFTQGGNLMSQSKDEVAGKLLLDLNEEGVLAEAAEVEDRRFMFQVTSQQSKKTIVLQAENARERDEWIATINNIVRDGGYVKGKSTGRKKDSVSQVSNELGSPRQQSPSSESASLIPSTTATPVEGLNLDTPIQFDLVSPTEGAPSLTPLTTPPNVSGSRRINPFDQSGTELLDTTYDNSAFAQNFTVRFLGSMEVKSDRGEQLVHNTIRQIMAARAIHNVFKMTESTMSVTSDGIRLIDPASNTVRVEFVLQDVSFWAAHAENNRLLGFITRNRTNSPAAAKAGPSPVTFACHVFETNSASEDICQAIKQATNIAFQALMDRKKGVTPPKPKMTPVLSDKALLLETINQLADQDDSAEDLPISPDGRFLLLSNTDSDPSSPTSPAFHIGDKGAAGDMETAADAENPDSESEA